MEYRTRIYIEIYTFRTHSMSTIHITHRIQQFFVIFLLLFGLALQWQVLNLCCAVEWGLKEAVWWRLRLHTPRKQYSIQKQNKTKKNSRKLNSNPFLPVFNRKHAYILMEFK